MKTFILMFAVLAVSGCSCHTIEPGERAVLVNWGKVQEPLLGEGFQTACGGCDFNIVSIRTQKKELESDCFSSDLQQVHVKLAVLYRIPEGKVIEVFRQYHGEPFDVLVAPRAQESLKEVTASRTAEAIVKDREKVKVEALEAIRKKVGDILVVDDVIIENIALSKELSLAIEQKMVQQQEAMKATFLKQKAQVDAETLTTKSKGEADSTLLKAKAEAEAIKIQGEALRSSPGVAELRLIEKWNGVTPQIVTGSGGGVSLLLPAAAKEK